MGRFDFLYNRFLWAIVFFIIAFALAFRTHDIYLSGAFLFFFGLIAIWLILLGLDKPNQNESKWLRIFMKLPF